MTDNTQALKAEKSAAFFKDSKVDTCSYVKVKHGQAVAVPYLTPNNLRKKDASPTDKKSVSHEIHRVRNHLYAGMKNKPLEPYNPDAQRSRLKTEEFQIPYKNTSQIILGNRSSNYKKHFVTTAQNLLKPPKSILTTNPGILSEKAKWLRKKEWS